MDFRYRKNTGITLLETVIAVAVASITLAFAVPAFQSLVERNRVAASVNTFVSHLHHARAEAIKRLEWVMLCPSSDGVTCTADYTQWGAGYIVFVDASRNRLREEPELLLSYFQGYPGITIHSSSNHRNTIAYRPSGRAWGFNTTVRFCAEHNQKNNRIVSISATGRPRTIETMPGGSAIECS